MTTLNKIKLGSPFQFEIDGAVFIKCRGGFRSAQGGALHACNPNQKIFIFKPCNM